MIDLAFNIPSNKNFSHENNSFSLSEAQIKKINLTFQMHKFEGIDALVFFEYARKAIQGREYAKFMFTKSVSEMLELIARYGEEVGLNREELSHIEIDTFLKITTKSNETGLENYLRKISHRNQESHSLAQLIKLPQILHDIAGVHVIPYQTSQPNFITQKQVSAELIRIGYEFDSNLKLDGKIVLVENADPGYDWLFSRKISGLITKYGGVNSHMAIRCAEFGLPAAIGCGEQRYDQLLKCSRVQLDCSAGTLNPVH
jgi:phosphohistidine swiveling domain-containing protein